MSSLKTVKKGEQIFKEGDKIASLILVQSGAASLCLQRQKKNIDLFSVGSPQVLGELGLTGAVSHPYSAVASNETKFVEFPLEAARAQIETAPQFVKILIKSLLDRLKLATSDLKSSKMEKDASPCPEDQVAKAFGAIFFTATHKGEKSEDPKASKQVSIEWTLMKQYAQRIFAESPRRLEQAINILVKMKMAKYEMGKPVDDPEGPDEIQRVIYFDLSAIEAFFEFYQYHYFKGGRGDILKVDDSSFNLVSMMLKMCDSYEPDRFGVVTLEYSKVLEMLKADYGFNLTSGHFTVLENKGVFAKRTTRQDGSVALQIEIKEWQTTLNIWRFIREIDKWNEKGFVDINEEEERAKKKAAENACPQCSAEVGSSAKFCQECGFKLLAA